MNCKFNNREGFIEKYLKNELDEREHVLFEEHYFSCDDCINELETTKQIFEMVKEEGKGLFAEYIKPPEALTNSKKRGFVDKNISRKWDIQPNFSYSIIAATLLFVGIYFLIPSGDYKNHAPSNLNHAMSKNNVPTQTDENAIIMEETEIVSEVPMAELYAANYIASDDLEYLIDQGFRDNDFVKVLSPETVITAKEEILFNWVSDSEQQLYLKILNNQEDVLHKLAPENNKILFNITENKLDPGLYYWKLENDDELLQLGKFFVKE